MPAKFDIILPTWGSGELPYNCVTSIMRQCKGSSDFRVIIIANPKEGKRFPASGNVFTMIEPPENIGYTKAINAGLALSTAPYVVLMNSDTEVVTDGWLEKLAGFLASLGAVGGQERAGAPVVAGEVPAAERRGRYVWQGRLTQSVFMTPACMEYVRSVLERFPVKGPVLELGSYNVNGSVRELFADMSRFPNYIGMDMRPGPGVDFVCETSNPIQCWPGTALAMEYWFGVVVTTEMLEHDRCFWETIGKAKDKLVSGGHIIITTRNIGFPRHDYPSDYYRFTADGLRAVLNWAGFTVLEAIDDPDDQGTFSVALK